MDIGGYTADILKISSGMLNLSVCDSLEYSTINFYNLAIKRINSTFDSLLDEIQLWLGHSDFSTTANIYAHLDMSGKQATADKMAECLPFASAKTK